MNIANTISCKILIEFLLPIYIATYYPAGPPHPFDCELRCPDTYCSGISDRCTIIWERLPTDSCSSLQFSVSLRQPDGTLVYSDVLSPNVSYVETAPLNQNTVYTVTIAAENACGSTNCSASNSTAVQGKNTDCWWSLLIY